MGNTAVQKNLDILTTNRRLLHKATADLSAEALIRIPEGFNNNVLWNVGHLVVTQQLLCYKLSGLDMGVDDAMVKTFGKGSSPKDWTETPDYEALLVPLHGLVESTRRDYAAGRFQGFNTYTTSTGYTLASIEDAIAFNNFHEGIHLGYILAMRRILG